MANGSITFNAKDYAPSNDVIILTQVDTATNFTDSIYLIADDVKTIFKNAMFSITIAGITTDVVVRLQGSLDNMNWFNLDREELDFTYTADGTYALLYEGNGELLYLRLLFVSEAGGTAATIDAKVKVF